MEQHPIPQQISSYQFKLVGDMTLKQFFQVAGGVLVSLLFYSTPLHPLIKWPIIFIAVALGVALAFLPFEERPLEKWIVAFFRSIYSPTIYTWKKTEKPPVFFTESAPAPEVGKVPSSQSALGANATKLEEAEKSFLSKITSLWSVAGNNGAPIQTTTPVTTSVPVSSVPAVSNTSTVPVPTTENSVTQPTPPKSVEVPQQIPTLITKSAPKLVVEEIAKPGTDVNVKATEINTPTLEEKPITSAQAEFSIDAAPPHPASIPNTIVGQVMDESRKIIENAILEIRDSNARPVRALKSNKAGHFIIVTPLSNGKYELTTEKEGFSFEPISFETKGEIIPPIAVKGKKVQ